MSTNDRTPEQERVYMEQFFRFQTLIDASKAEELRLRPVDPEPNYDDILAMYGPNEPTAEELAAGMTTVDGETFFNLSAAPGYMQRMELRRKASKQRREEWEAEGSDDWKAARERTAELYAQLYQVKEDLEEQFKRENFAALNGDREKILDDARQIAATESFMLFFDGGHVPVAEPIDEATAAFTIKGALRLHYAFFESDPDGVSALDGIVIAAIRKSLSPPAQKGKKYRTRANAAADGAITALPDYIATPSLAHFEAALSTREEKGSRANLVPFLAVDGLRFSEGKIYIEGMKEATEAELQDLRTKEGISEIDLPFLHAIYSIIYHQFKKSGMKEVPGIVEVYGPDFSNFIGSHSNMSTEDVNRIKSKIYSYHNITGIIREQKNARTPGYYQILNFEYYNPHKNIFAFSSPYMSRVIKVAHGDALMHDKNGKIKLQEDGTPRLHPFSTEYCKPSILKEKNEAAVQNVFIVVTTIAQAGPAVHDPHISARTIVERNQQFAARLERSANPTVLLKTTFKKTWELLRECTTLQDRFLDIQLPDPNDPRNIPTLRTLDTVFTFSHKGKRARN